MMNYARFAKKKGIITTFFAGCAATTSTRRDIFEAHLLDYAELSREQCFSPTKFVKASMRFYVFGHIGVMHWT